MQVSCLVACLGDIMLDVIVDAPHGLAADDDTLRGAGVEVNGPIVAHPGTVMSLVSKGSRSMASDPGSTDWLDAVAPGAWLEDADCARAAGTRVCVDLSSAAMIEEYGVDGVEDLRSPRPGPVRDVTGAGDALAAGFLLGGAGLAMDAAARCVAEVGAQPPFRGAVSP